MTILVASSQILLVRLHRPSARKLSERTCVESSKREISDNRRASKSTPLAHLLVCYMISYLSFLSPVVVPDPSEEDKLAIATEYDKDHVDEVVGIAIIVASGSVGDEEAETALERKDCRGSMVTVCEHRVSRSGAAVFQRCQQARNCPFGAAWPLK